MKPTPFSIRTATPEADGAAVEALLHRVYVQDGFTAPDVARSLFAPAVVFERGTVLVEQEQENALAGMVIVVPPTSPARKFAEAGEAEMHLLAVSPDHRKSGLGGALVTAALEQARSTGHSKMILWTQPTMTDAHRLYERHGFARVPSRDFERAGRAFRVFERAL